MTALAMAVQAAGIEEAELVRWVESGWVQPEGEAGSWVFHEVDVARICLIAEIRRDLLIDDEAVPVVLSLLDQVYGLRHEIAALCGAIATQPPDVREAIAAALGAARGPTSRT
jgi:chaperone modulatory protein CbpM